MAKIFHVLPYENWMDIKNSNSLTLSPESLKHEGFIHCCKADQLSGVIERFFGKDLKLSILRINESRLDKDVVYEAPIEAPNSGLLFPHYYGEIPVESIERSFLIKRKSLEDTFDLPEHLLT